MGHLSVCGPYLDDGHVSGILDTVYCPTSSCSGFQIASPCKYIHEAVDTLHSLLGREIFDFCDVHSYDL